MQGWGECSAAPKLLSSFIFFNTYKYSACKVHMLKYVFSESNAKVILLPEVTSLKED